MPKQPNIVLCLCDQLRAFETGCYGNPVIRTPNVDRLAREGVRFALATTNFPVCMAARSVLLSGQYNRTCTGGVSNVTYQTWPGDCAMPEYPFPGRPHLPQRTLPEALQDAGYHTRAIGKWHIHSWPSDIGFDHYLIPRVHHCHSGQHFTENGGPEFVPDQWSVDFEAERVEDFLEGQRAASQPFFLYYSISPPHCPVTDAPEEYRTMYDPAQIPLRPNVDLSQPLKNEEYWWRVYRHDFRYYNLRLPYTEVLPAGYGLRELIAEYYGVTTWMDTAVGRMLAALDRTGLAEDTIVIFTSDHGDNLGSLGLVQKGGPTEESIRIPLLLRYPAAVAPVVVERPVASLVDVAPTLLELAGLPVEAHMPGQSLAPLVTGRGTDLPRDYCFTECGRDVAVRTPTHMCFLRRNRETNTLEDRAQMFYNLAEDPYQLRNLADRDEQVATRRELEALLRDFDRTTPWLGQ